MLSPRLDQLRIRHLKFVSLLASKGSLAATAEHLSMSPSAASMMLKEIEGVFGAKLFRRQGRGMALTEQGMGLLPRCQTVLGEVGAMRASMVGVKQPLLRIGAFPHTTETLLPKIVKCLIADEPSWRIQIFDRSADELMELLQAAEIDLMLGRLSSKAAASPVIGGFEQRILYQSSLSIVTSRQHSLVGRTDLTMKDLLEWPWVLPSMQSTTRVAVVDAYLRKGLAPPVPIVESPSFFYSLSLVAHTDFLTCCAHSAALQNSHQTAVLPINMGLESTPVALIWRKSSALACRAMALLEQALPK